MADAPINSFNFLDELKSAVGGGGGSVEPATTTTLGTVYLQSVDGDIIDAKSTAANATTTRNRTNFLAYHWFIALQTPIIPDNITWLKVAKIPVKTTDIFATNTTSYLRSGMVMFVNAAEENKTLAANTVFATGLALRNGLTNSCMIMHADGTITGNTLKAASSKSICFTADITFPANSTTYVFIEEDN